MRTLLNDRYAPTTSSIGYLRLSLEAAATALVAWRRSLHRKPKVERGAGTLEDALRRLQPLTEGARPRELLIEVTGGWTAYFDCGSIGTDPIGVVIYLSKVTDCDGLAIDVVPNTIDSPHIDDERYGGVQFQLFGPAGEPPLNYVRVVAAVNDGGKWVFDTYGTPLPFEDLEAYKARRVRDRFTSEMLERYCRSLGLDIFDPAAYGPRYALVRSSVRVPNGAQAMSLEQAQRHCGIVPGLAGCLADACRALPRPAQEAILSQTLRDAVASGEMRVEYYTLKS